MAVVIDATVGGASSNSYATLADAEAYMEGRLNASLWDAATDDNKNRALVEATRELEVLAWEGQRASSTQALSWPRDYVTNPDDPDGDDYASTVLPVRVTDACMELAFQFLNAGTTDVAALDTSDGVIRKKVDVLETEWARPGERLTGLQRYPRVWDRLTPLLGVSGPVIGVVRG
jgi:hypothetical protein